MKLKLDSIISLAILSLAIYRQNTPVKQDDIADPVDLASYGPLWNRSLTAFNDYVEMYRAAAEAGTNTELMREGLQFIHGSVGSSTFFAYSDLSKASDMETAFAAYAQQRADLLLDVTAAMSLPLPSSEEM